MIIYIEHYIGGCQMNLLKRTSKWMIVLMSLLLLISCSNQKKESKEVSPFEIKQLNEVFLQGDFERIHEQMSESFRAKVSLQDLQTDGKQFNEGVTEYIFQLSEPVDANQTGYIWFDQTGTKRIIAVADKTNMITGLIIGPNPSFPETDKIYTKNTYIMPIQEEWFTFWGGTNESLNYHYPYESQRYAYDLVIMKDNQSFQGDAKANESYYAYGKPLIAPADGVVVGVEMNLEDNVPVGKMNPEKPYGNYVIIDHGKGEYSVIAHMKYQSAAVKIGDQVKQGDPIGLCGNSGNSSEAHIHFQVQDSPDLEAGKSIRIKFKDNIEPIRGQFVSPSK
jgi:Peptidase family M23